MRRLIHSAVIASAHRAVMGARFVPPLCRAYRTVDRDVAHALRNNRNGVNDRNTRKLRETAARGRTFE
jgi:hypothetical protein